MQRRLLTLFSLILLGFSAINTVFASEVTLKNKIGQMLMIGFKGMELKPEDAIVKTIQSQSIGGVILFDYDFPTKKYEHNIKSPAQLKHLTEQLQEYTSQAAIKNANNLLPLLISLDYEGGKVDRLKEDYGFPKTLSAAYIGSGSYQEARQAAQQMAKTLKAAGINLNFAPVVDVNVNPNNPVIGKLERSFSASPQKVTDYAAIFSQAYQEQNILCAYKHFPGHGSSTEDTHAGFVDITKTWNKKELEPYEQLFQLNSSCPIVMTAHVVHSGLDDKNYPASLSAGMVQELLRNKLNFEGVVITDDLQMKAIAENYPLADVVRLVINSGADILVFANQLSQTSQNPEEIVEMIYQDVKQGKIPESRINQSFERIMKLKSKLNSEKS